MHRVARHLATHHGVITRDEALRLGVSKRTVSRKVARGEWLVIHPGVYRLAGAPRTWFGDARAATCAAGGLLSHRGSARGWQIAGYERAPVEITIAHSRRVVLDGRVTVRRSTQMHLADRVVRWGVPMTGVARTVLDLAAIVDRVELDRVVDAVLRQRLVQWHDLMSARVRHSRRGRTGCGRLGELLDERFGEERPPDSVFNRMVFDLLVAAGVGRPVFEHEIFDGDRFVARVDLAFPAERLAIELDSRAHHDNPLSFVADPRRANRIVNLGWHLLRFTWDDYRDHPDLLVETVRDALRLRRSGED